MPTSTLIGRKLSVPLDINLFTDRDRHGAERSFGPTELDLITGLTTTHSLVKGLDGELGARVEHDRPVDRGASRKPTSTPQPPALLAGGRRARR